MTKAEAKQAEQDDIIKRLRELFPVGSTAYTVLRHVSRSGMSRSISVLTVNHGDPFDATWLVARAMGYKIDQRHDGIKMGGCGMDMGFALVYNLSRVIYRDSFRCTGKRDCLANDHVNERGEARERGYRKGRLHSDAGYALNHRWM